MIANDHEFKAMLDRIARFQAQVVRMRQVEMNPVNYRQSADGFLSEIDRMQLEIREYLMLHPSELSTPSG